MLIEVMIHNDPGGSIVRAVPYELIAQMTIEHDSYMSCEQGQDVWRVDYTLQNEHGNSFYTTQEEAERLFAEWQAYWKKQITLLDMITELQAQVADLERVQDRMDEDIAFLIDPKHHERPTHAD